MTAAISLSGLVPTTVPARGEKAGDNATAAAAFDSMLTAKTGRETGKGQRMLEDGGNRATWSWSRLQQGAEDGGTPVLGRGGDELETGTKKPSPDGEETEFSGEEGSPTAPALQKPPVLRTSGDADGDTPDDDATMELERQTGPRMDGVGSDSRPNARGQAGSQPQTAQVSTGQSAESGTMANDPRATQAAMATDTVMRSGLAKPAAEIALDRPVLDRAPTAQLGEPGTRADALRKGPSTRINAPAANAGEALSGLVTSDPDGKTVIGKRHSVAPSLAAQLRQEVRNSDPLAQRVTVLSNQSTPVAPPAPALAQLSQLLPSSQVVNALREETQAVSRAAAAAMEAQDFGSTRSRPLHTIQIQLQPNDLGRVTARMTMEGNQLHVELRVETSQARAQLTNDADSILKSLKASGFEIDRVSIQQVQPGNNSATTNGQERGGNPMASQQGSSDEASDQRRQNSFGDSGANGRQEGNDGTHQKVDRGGLFI
jgi:chemotaxis protein MotD